MLTRSRQQPAVVPAAHRMRPVIASPVRRPAERVDTLTITWIGHSSFLIQCRGLNILTDPIWSDRASPVSFAGPRRLVPPFLRLEDLPPIDVTLISHDHYDHLDDPTIGRLIGRFPAMCWLAPLRVGGFLERRGAANVKELDWWQEHETAGIIIGCTPAQHFSGRYPWNRNSTLWCGWTLSFGRPRVFFAGDTALHPEFGAIAERFGPFDMAILPIGAYEPRWFMRQVHMNPTDSIAAFQQLTAVHPDHPCIMVGSHWGTFRLTDEPVMEPPILAREIWSRASLSPNLLWILAHGETREVPAL
ncbi:MAG: MBL fold metallo-hydrolase [Gemmatimonadaceae bacterium]|nr:MBL fold metallo-hydrolase [Gemmatimonadaceae bacterium]